MELIIGMVIGILVGVIWRALAKSDPIVGTIHVNKVEPDEPPYMFLELHKGIETVITKGTVHLKVDSKDYTSHN